MIAERWRASAGVRLAFANAVGFSASGAVPFWIAGVGDRFGLPLWSGAALATFQLICASLVNIVTPWVFKPGVSKTKIGMYAAIVTIAGNLIAIIPSPLAFVAGIAIAGAGLGVLLNMTNRLAAETQSVERAYAVFEIVGVVFSMSLYLTLPVLASALGFGGIFIALAVVAGVAWLDFATLRSSPAAALAQTPERTAAVIRSGAGGAKLIGLAAMFLMFVGQSSISSVLVPIGGGLSLDPVTVGRIMALGLVVAIAGGFLARLLADKLGNIVPIIGGSVALGLDAIMVTGTDLAVVFKIFAIFYFVCIVFITPYAFSILARIDTSGRTASIGPAFLMVGVAMGPSVGAFANAAVGPRAVGWISAGCVAVAATLFVIAAARGRKATV